MMFNTVLRLYAIRNGWHFWLHHELFSCTKRSYSETSVVIGHNVSHLHFLSSPVFLCSTRIRSKTCVIKNTIVATEQNLYRFTRTPSYCSLQYYKSDILTASFVNTKDRRRTTSQRSLVSIDIFRSLLLIAVEVVSYTTITLYYVEFSKG